jgi:hypothetical protein
LREAEHHHTLPLTGAPMSSCLQTIFVVVVVIFIKTVMQYSNFNKLFSVHYQLNIIIIIIIIIIILLYPTICSPKLREAKVLVHFHSFSCVATLTSSITRGTQPPNTNMRLPMMVDECKLLGRGAMPWMFGLLQLIVSVKSSIV